MSSNSPINQAEMRQTGAQGGWKDGANEGVSARAQKLPHPAFGTLPWSHGLLNCFSRPGLCCLACWCPCFVYGKTRHRVKKDDDMTRYEPLNTSCLLYCVARQFGVDWVVQTIHLEEMREKYQIEGSCMGDCLKSYYCTCCSLIQAEREMQGRLVMGPSVGGVDGADDTAVVDQQYQREDHMAMGALPRAVHAEPPLRIGSTGGQAAVSSESVKEQGDVNVPAASGGEQQEMPHQAPAQL